MIEIKSPELARFILKLLEEQAAKSLSIKDYRALKTFKKDNQHLLEQ